MDKVKGSYYNFIIDQGDKGYILYNSLSGVIISVTGQEELKRVKEVLGGEEVLYNKQDEIIQLLYEKGILINTDTDELEYLQFLYEQEVVRSQALSIMLITTRQCNLRCVYCYEKHENLAMSLDVYNSIALYIEKSLMEKKYTSVNITLFGGEPFIEYENVVNFLKDANRICDKYNVPFGAGATSNGVLITPGRFEELYGLGVTYYQITIDGLEDTHNLYRQCADGSGSFKKIIENLKYMAGTDYGFEVTIRTNFNNEVFRKAKEFYKFIATNFDQRFHVYYEGIKKLGGSNDGELDVLDKSEVSESSVDIAAYIRELGLKNDVVDEMTLPFNRICYATKHNDFIVDYDGSILKCTLSLDDELNRIGRIYKDGTMEIDDYKHARWVGKKSQLAGQCKTCKVLPLCYGGRCVNGRVHGEDFECDRDLQEQELARLIVTI
ncbi:MAG: radical SAM protein [Lachnospiraceae bacterium]|nr:radical SAM protein [Lachnospiraceae bacterium]